MAPADVVEGQEFACCGGWDKEGNLRMRMYGASLTAFCLSALARCPTGLTPPCEAVVKGDAKCTNIAAASIIAKVTRDRLMREYHERWPEVPPPPPFLTIFFPNQ